MGDFNKRQNSVSLGACSLKPSGEMIRMFHVKQNLKQNGNEPVACG